MPRFKTVITPAGSAQVQLTPAEETARDAEEAAANAATAAASAEAARVASIRADAGYTNLLDAIKAATPAQIDTYLDNNVTDLASARAVLKRMAKLLAVVIKRVNLG